MPLKVREISSSQSRDLLYHAADADTLHSYGVRPASPRSMADRVLPIASITGVFAYRASGGA